MSNEASKFLDMAGRFSLSKTVYLTGLVVGGPDSIMARPIPDALPKPIEYRSREM
jgi:hypothetical protein